MAYIGKYAESNKTNHNFGRRHINILECQQKSVKTFTLIDILDII
jgi:hypothetical protein